jgi:alpha-L-rhamnosidase
VRLDLGAELTGFIDLEIETSGGRLYISFDEILSDGDVNFTRFGACSAMIYDLGPGRYKLTGFEPYSLRYAKFASDADRAVITSPGLIRFEFTSSGFRKKPDFGDWALSRVYDAAVSTFRQNTVDIFMDCPSRERAG